MVRSVRLHQGRDPMQSRHHAIARLLSALVALMGLVTIASALLVHDLDRMRLCTTCCRLPSCM